MKRLIALLVAALFSTGMLAAPTVWAQAPKAAPAPAKSDAKPAVKDDKMAHEPLDLKLSARSGSGPPGRAHWSRENPTATSLTTPSIGSHLGFGEVHVC